MDIMVIITIVGLIFASVTIYITIYIARRQYLLSKKQLEVSLSPPSEPKPGGSPSSPISLGTIYLFEEIFQRLDRNTRKSLAILDAFGGDFSLAAGTFVTQLSVSNFNNLIALSILQESSNERYNLHPMFKLSVQREVDRLKDKTAFEKIADYYLNLIQRNPGHLEKEISNVFKAMDWCYENGRWQKVIAYMRAMDSFLKSKWEWGIRCDRLRQAVKAAEMVKDRSNTATFKENLAVITMKQGNFEEAKKMFEDNLKKAKNIKDKGEIADNFHWLGRVAEATGDYTEAERLYKESLKIEQELGNKRSIADTLHESGVLAYRMRDYEKAKRLYEEALELERETNYERTMACTLHALALLIQEDDYKEKNYTEAERLYKESLEIKRDLNDSEEIALTLYQLASLYKKQKKYVEALPLSQESVQIFEKLGHRYLGTAQELLREIKENRDSDH